MAVGEGGESANLKREGGREGGREQWAVRLQWGSARLSE